MLQKIPLTKEKIKYFLDYIPLFILTASALHLTYMITSTNLTFLWKHGVGLVFLPLNYFLFYKNHKLGVLGLGLTLILGLASVISYYPTITTSTMGIGIKEDIKIPLFYGQPIFLWWLLIHFVLSGRYYFGILTKKYWQSMLQAIR